MRLRSLLRPSSLTIIATLAVSLGVLTTAFGIAWAALWRPLPLAGADRLAMLYTTHADGAESRREARWSYPRLQLLRRTATSFTDVAAYTGTEVSLTGSDDTEAIRGEFVSPSYFSVLGVLPSAGRSFSAQEEDPSLAAPVAVIGHDLWQRRFGASRDVVGKTIGINGITHDIIGVMPAGFRGLTDRAQLWLPSTMAPRLTYPEYLTTEQDFISVVARLVPGTTVTQATRELETLVPRLYAQIAGEEPNDTPSGVARDINTARVPPSVRPAVLLLLGAVALLHLLACANVTSLLMGHALARRGEWAVRTALGCTPRALFLAHYREAMLLVLIGGTVGTALAAGVAGSVQTPLDVWGARNFYGALAAFATPAFSWVTVAFGALMTIASATAVALLPSLSAVQAATHDTLHSGARGASTQGTSLRRPSARAFVVAAEVALAVMLCIAGGLMIDSFNRMRQVALGVDVDGVLTFLIRPPDARVPPDRAPAYVDRMLQAITAIPGVSSVTVDGGAPVSGTARSTLFIAGREVANPDDAPRILRHYVAPAHFTTLGIPLVRGRSFAVEDRAGRPGVTVISESAARRFWPGEDPIGQRVWFGGGSAFDSPERSVEVIGIVKDVMYEPLEQGPNQSSFYTPYAQFTYGWRQYFVRTTGDPLAFASSIRQAVHAVDPDTPVTELQTLQSLVGASWSRQRFDAVFYGGFALLALGLAISGIYAVVSFAVAQRTREMGIRLALGARPGSVVRLVVREGVLFPMVGLAVGSALAVGVGGVLRGMLYEVAPTDPRIIGGTATLIVLAAIAACLVPGWRATRVDPGIAMRVE